MQEVIKKEHLKLKMSSISTFTLAFSCHAIEKIKTFTSKGCVATVCKTSEKMKVTWKSFKDNTKDVDTLRRKKRSFVTLFATFFKLRNYFSYLGKNIICFDDFPQTTWQETKWRWENNIYETIFPPIKIFWQERKKRNLAKKNNLFFL